MKVALGTDGSASNNATSMFREMYLFSCLQKEAMKDASAVSAEEALTAATVNGYEALGFRGGVLKKGNFADIILVDLAAPNMRPLSDVKKNLVYSADSSNVLMTVAAGKSFTKTESTISGKKFRPFTAKRNTAETGYCMKRDLRSKQ